jgi:heptosyltransferase-2
LNPFENVLVYAPSWIGDAVMSLGALRQLRTRYPEARLTVLARPWVVGLYRGCEAVDDTLEYDYRGRHRGPFGFFRLSRELDKHGFDLALLFPNAFRAAAVVRAAGIPERWGYGTDGRSLLLTRSVPPAPRPFGRHQAFYYLDMMRALGFDAGPPDTTLRLTTEMRQAARRLLESFDCQPGEPLIGIHPGAAGGTAKRWIREHYAEVGERLASTRHGRVVLLGGPGELDLTREIRSRIQAPVIDLATKTSLVELMGVIDALSVLVTNDSGPMHLAAALGTPTVAIFGPTDERETGPMGRHSKVLRKHVDCSPCLLKDCPTDHRCMTEVGVEEVVDAAAQLLDKKYKSQAAEAAS